MLSTEQETSDGQLAVLHDLQSVLQASEGHSINTMGLMELSRAAPDLDRAEVKVNLPDSFQLYTVVAFR